MELTIKVSTHIPTGWMIATCDDLPEFFVQGRNLEQILERAPNVVLRVLQRRGPATTSGALRINTRLH
ncbi:hypothetical protein FHT76_000222 [Rhizobium sp. BK176]|nr:hypothetical protein [Rhizobium sp. BK176]